MKSYEEREFSNEVRGLAGTIKVPAGSLRRRSSSLIGVVRFVGATIVLIAFIAVAVGIAGARPVIDNSVATTPRVASRSIQATPVAAIPREFAYVEAGPGRAVTLRLVDLSGSAPPAEVARWSFGSHTYAASRDGKTIIIAAPGERSIAGLHVLHPLTGEATVLFEGPPDGRVFYPQLSPDGKRFAFMLMRQVGSDGIWVGDISDGSVRQLYASPDGRATLFGWSDDGQWLSYSAYDTHQPTGPRIFLHNVIDGRRIDAGPGSLISWRALEPRVLAAVVGGKGDQGAFGATVYTFDVAQQRRTELFSTDPALEAVVWNPGRDEFLYLQKDTGCSFVSSVWVRSLDAASARQVGNIQNAQAAWWSADGGTIYALVAGSGTEGIVINASTGQRIATIPEAGPSRPCP
jgi:hypothetical protein